MDFVEFLKEFSDLTSKIYSAKSYKSIGFFVFIIGVIILIYAIITLGKILF